MNEVEILDHVAVRRVRDSISANDLNGEIVALNQSARTALEAAEALGIRVGQIASSIVFKLTDGNPLLVITSGRHRVDTELVATNLGVEKLLRADADFVRSVSGFAIGGVAPIGWTNKPELILVDEALDDYEVVWAAAGHPHAVFPTTFAELMQATSGTRAKVGD